MRTSQGSLREEVTMFKTARDLTGEELLSYRPWDSLEHYRDDPRVLKRMEHAWEVARAAARLLKRRYGATRVVAFGSMVHKTRFTPWSDVDLAAWGIPHEDYYDAAGAAMDLGLEAGIKVDVVDIEHFSHALQEEVDHEGIDL
jgi:predicted nucleotidyltransferase